MMDSAVSNACILMGDILQRLIVIFRGLRVFPQRMRRNLDLSGGLIMSEAIMLELGKHVGRQRAHDAVYDAAQASAREGRPLRELLAESKEIGSHLSEKQIEELLDPATYTGVCDIFAVRAAERARALAQELPES
jgi:3-carboxy-cis,cis-muconate cycloisomerase